MSTDSPNLPPSAELVKLALTERGPCTRLELLDVTNRAESTLYDALNTLDDHGILERCDDSDGAVYDIRPGR